MDYLRSLSLCKLNFVITVSLGGDFQIFLQQPGVRNSLLSQCSMLHIHITHTCITKTKLSNIYLLFYSFSIVFYLRNTGCDPLN